MPEGVHVNSIKHMPVKEFRAEGYIMEINRRFLHPMGLALEVTVDNKTGEESISGVWDYRDDPEGVAYAEGELDASDFLRAHALQLLWEQRRPSREAGLGFMIQTFQSRPN